MPISERAAEVEDRAREDHRTGDVQEVSFREALRVWIRVALLSFGGPAGQIAVMHRIVVEEKQWISEPRFLHALNYCMLAFVIWLLLTGNWIGSTIVLLTVVIMGTPARSAFRRPCSRPSRAA
jgi:hypothetical protein